MSADERLDSEFERRTRELLLASAEHLPGAVRSRLTQARYAALAQLSTSRPSIARRWLPAGAAAAALLAMLVLYAPARRTPVEGPVVSAGLEDIEILAASDALPLETDQSIDDDFYEWAANEASGVTAPSVGT